MSRPGSFSSSANPTQTSSGVGTVRKKSSTNVGAIAGGAVGGLAGLALLGGLVYYLLKKSGRSGRDDTALDDDFFGVGTAASAGAGPQPTFPVVDEANVGGQGAAQYGNPFTGYPQQWSPSQGAGVGYGGGEAGYGAGGPPGSGYAPGNVGAGGNAGGNAGWAHDGGAGAGWSHDGGASAGIGPNSTGPNTQMSQLSPTDPVPIGLAGVGTVAGGLGVAAAVAQQRQQTQTPDTRQSVVSHPSTLSSGSVYPDGVTASSASNRPLMVSPASHSGHGHGGPAYWSGAPEVQDRDT